MKHKLVLVGLALAMAACSSNETTTPTFVRGTQQGQPAQTTATPLPARAVVVEKIVTVDGVLALRVPEISLGFDASGTVTQVNATLGQIVKKGAVLAMVENTELQDVVDDAQAQVDSTKASIAQQSKPATKEDLAAAQAALNSAYVSYNTTKAGSTAADIESARAGLESAKTQYLSAQTARDSACGGPGGTGAQACKTQEAAYGNAYESMVAAESRYKALLVPPSKEALMQAYNSVASAKARLDALKVGLTEEQQKINETQLSQAEAALERAKANLTSAQLISPCDCVVQAVSVAVGMAAGSGGGSGAFSLVNVNGLQFKTTNLTERDVANIKAGGATTIRLKAHSDVFTGKVSAVLGQSSGSQSGTALFTVLVDLDATDKRLLPGMTGQAEIAFQ
ncbi:MAG: biotin/lipoyl-binding protein [Anaerolineae bacterium]|nr:biotin/lipoyl-binding protein [Anaerolineae bacterium]